MRESEPALHTLLGVRRLGSLWAGAAATVLGAAVIGATIEGALGPRPAPGADAWYLVWLAIAHLPGGPGCWVEECWEIAYSLISQYKREHRVASDGCG